MSLLDARDTPAWTTILIDRGPSYGAQRYGGYAPQRYLSNMGALAYLDQYPRGSSLMQWNGKAWQHMIRPQTPAELVAAMKAR
jgi:hypothetical protein